MWSTYTPTHFCKKLELHLLCVLCPLSSLQMYVGRWFRVWAARRIWIYRLSCLVSHFIRPNIFQHFPNTKRFACLLRLAFRCANEETKHTEHFRGDLIELGNGQWTLKYWFQWGNDYLFIATRQSYKYASSYCVVSEMTLWSSLLCGIELEANGNENKVKLY